jgi:hypothetical protein
MDSTVPEYIAKYTQRMSALTMYSGTLLLSPPISEHVINATAETIRTPRRLPSIGENPRRVLEDRCHSRVGGGHHADRRGGEANLVHEEFLDRNPQHRALQRHCDVKRQQPLLQ